MAKKGNLILLGIALVLALLTTFVVMRSFSHVQKSPAPVSSVVPQSRVVVVKQKLGSFQKINAADVAIQQVPTSAVQPGAATQLSQVLGQYTVTDWLPGQQVIAGMYGSAQQTYFASAIPHGLLAITIPDNPVAGVDHLIVPGNHVDLFMVSGQAVPATSGATSGSLGFIPNSAQAAAGLSAVQGALGNGQGGQNGQTKVTVTSMKDILVLYVEQIQAAAGGGKEQNGSGDYLTLAVTPAQAQTIVTAETSGPIFTVLRSSTNH